MVYIVVLEYLDARGSEYYIFYMETFVENKYLPSSSGVMESV
jgi:hypothetical protein